MLGAVGQVDVLARILVLVVQLGRPVGPFGVAPALSSDGSSQVGELVRSWGGPTVPRVGTAADDREGGSLPGAVGIAKQRTKARSFEVARRRQAVQVGEGGIKVHQLDQAWRGRACLGTRCGDDQGDSHSLLEERHLVMESAVLSVVVSVVGVEDDDRLVPELETVERIEQQADLRVHEADAREVGCGHRTVLSLGQGDIAVVVGQGQGGNAAEMLGGLDGPGDLLRRIEVKIFLRSNVRPVRPAKAGRQVERLPFAGGLFEDRDREPRGLTVPGVGVVGLDHDPLVSTVRG